MVELIDLSTLIPQGPTDSLSPAGQHVALSHLVDINRALLAQGPSALHDSLRQVLLRLLETSILSHPRISKLIDVWEGIAGSANERIERHLTDILLGKPDESLVRHVFRCLSGSAAQRGRHSGSHAHYFEDVIGRLSTEKLSQRPALRCECCGYHFRKKDMKGDRQAKILEAGFELEGSLFPGRSDDPYKPVDRGKGVTWTQLSIDHVVPEETLGWSDPDNLAVLCMFCNMGKVAYRRPLEGLSAFAVGALAETPRDRPWGVLKHQVIVAALASQGGTCRSCGQSKQQVELTVRPVVPEGNYITGFLPWNLHSVCYVCLANSDDDVVGSTDQSQSYPLGLSQMEMLEDTAGQEVEQTPT
ncbi:HNH endonuclease [Rhizobium sp. WYCCWR 11128]|uniref:HNH endonuclease n=1 Tax=Rhizobium sp. WYCCWR 11128 TaxID=2749832 RepID=UPI0015D14D8D|nr:HNH endonuclease [Rhizobium sp. WYCCWR 11128]NYT32058.1 hypothetical protein [Rhizobium sp. WYCCWR 11128]